MVNPLQDHLAVVVPIIQRLRLQNPPRLDLPSGEERPHHRGGEQDRLVGHGPLGPPDIQSCQIRHLERSHLETELVQRYYELARF